MDAITERLAYRLTQKQTDLFVLVFAPERTQRIVAIGFVYNIWRSAFFIAITEDSLPAKSFCSYMVDICISVYYLLVGTTIQPPKQRYGKMRLAIVAKIFVCSAIFFEALFLCFSPSCNVGKLGLLNRNSNSL